MRSNRRRRSEDSSAPFGGVVVDIRSFRRPPYERVQPMTDTSAAALRGLLVPLVTPFTADGEDVALDALEGLAHSVLDEGAIGLVVLGTTGEPATLDTAAKDAVVALCARVCRDRAAALIVGAGSNDTRGSRQALAAFADRPEISAALAPVPYFTRPSEAGVVAHF